MVTETQKPILRIEVTARTMVTAVVVAGCAWVTIRLAPVLLVLVVALVLVGTLNPAVEWLEARRFKRGTSIATVFGALFTGFAGIVALTVPALVAQVSEFVSAAPAARTRLIEALEQSQYTAPLSHSIQTMDYGDLAKSVAQRALDISGRSAEIVAYLASAIFLALYMMLDRDRLRGGLYSLVPRTHHIRLSRVLVSLEVIVGGYVRGQFITSALMSLFTFILLVACGVKGALAVALVAGMADVLPYLGVFISVGFALAASASKGWLVVLIVLALMLAYEELESRVLVPRIYGRVLKLPSSVVLFSLLTGGR